MKNKALMCACLLESFFIITESVGHRSSAAETIWKGKVRSKRVRLQYQAKKTNVFDRDKLAPSSTISTDYPRAVLSTPAIWPQSPSAALTETATKAPTALRIRFPTTRPTSALRATETLPIPATIEFTPALLTGAPIPSHSSTSTPVTPAPMTSTPQKQLKPTLLTGSPIPSHLSTSTPVTPAPMTSTPQKQVPTVSPSVLPEHSVKKTYIPSSLVPSPDITLVPSPEPSTDPTLEKSNLPSLSSTKKPSLKPTSNITIPTYVSLSPEIQFPSGVPSDGTSSSSPVSAPSYEPSSEFSLFPSIGYSSSSTPSQNPSETPISITIDPSNTVVVTTPSLVPSIHDTLTTTPGLGYLPTILTSLPSFQKTVVSSEPESRGPTCAIDGAGIYGDDLGFVSRLDYVYELIVPTATTTENVNVILTYIERAISNALLSTLFPNSCNSTGLGGRGRMVNLVALSGLGSDPLDVIFPDVSCRTQVTEENKCFVFDGAISLFTLERQNMTETIILGKKVITSALKSSIFDSIDGVTKIEPREDASLKNINADEIVSPIADSKIPIWAWIFLFGGITMFGCMFYCCYVIPRRKAASPREGSERHIDTNDPEIIEEPHMDPYMDDSWVITPEEAPRRQVHRNDSFSGRVSKGDSYSASRTSESYYSSEYTGDTRETRETRGSARSRKSRAEVELHRVYSENKGAEEDPVRPNSGRTTTNRFEQPYGSGACHLGSMHEEEDDQNDENDLPVLAPMLPVGNDRNEGRFDKSKDISPRIEDHGNALDKSDDDQRSDTNYVFDNSFDAFAPVDPPTFSSQASERERMFAQVFSSRR